MSDYLSELAARNLGTAEVVQPRLASRFEPAGQGSALDPAPPGFNAADAPGGLAEITPGHVAPPATRQQPLAPDGTSHWPPIAPGPARWHVGDLGPAPSFLQPLPNAQNFDPATSVTSVDQPATKPGRSEPISPTHDQSEDIRRLSLHPNAVAVPAQPPDKVGSLVSQSDLPIQTPMHPLSRQEERRLDQQMRTAVDNTLTLQRTKRDNDGFGQVERNAAHSPVGPTLSQGARDLDERIRWAIEGAMARQNDGKGVEESAITGYHRSDQIETIEERSANSRTNPTRAESTLDIKPAVLARVITQPQVVSASPVLPGSPAKGAADGFDTHQEPQSPPTIHVTIGRIEVRATPAPTATATGKSRQAPVVSLDDYLRQRNRGGQ